MKNKTSYFKIVAGTIAWDNWGKRLSAGERSMLVGHL